MQAASSTTRRHQSWTDHGTALRARRRALVARVLRGVALIVYLRRAAAPPLALLPIAYAHRALSLLRVARAIGHQYLARLLCASCHSSSAATTRGINRRGVADLDRTRDVNGAAARHHLIARGSRPRIKHARRGRRKARSASSGKSGARVATRAIIGSIAEYRSIMRMARRGDRIGISGISRRHRRRGAARCVASATHRRAAASIFAYHHLAPRWHRRRQAGVSIGGTRHRAGHHINVARSRKKKTKSSALRIRTGDARTRQRRASIDASKASLVALCIVCHRR